ncbi:Por secretion system C-terminal sorting domain-containing protein [Mariniphaga anaerophila]|uniref:Por secretion system C-terminal sorting domain-containing protein n=1 Tax=Mariniphaga anaerophila TaxID=1484053 RepID=A0A1M5FLL4_9BACT|nr:T9SS type A sorting domain-containing protein [Mariniphaga anaerophila]SHF92477.1 Por secretion system C-terminal sorting domain-containing protein [Mariniphaga anaerophila]
MKKFLFVGVLLLGAFALKANNLSRSNVQEETADSANIALIATPSTSFVSGWENLNAVNDGFSPSHSGDKSNTAYGNWNNPNSYQWVQYNWDQKYIAKSVEIYWFDDNGGVLTPEEAFIENYNEETSEWVRIVDVPLEKDKFNYASLGDITTSTLRVTMFNSQQSTGILEFRVWGTTLNGGTDVSVPSKPGTPKIVNKSGNSIMATWEPSEDDARVAGYNIYVNDSIIKEVTTESVVIDGLPDNFHFMLATQAIDGGGNLSEMSNGIWIFMGDEESAAHSYNWPTYTPTLNYNFKDEFPSLEMPTEDLDDCEQVVGTQSDGWWTFKWGPNKRSLVTEAAITPMLERFNEDFAFFRDTMGWPPDKRAKDGFRSAIYLYGSGLTCIDNADSTDLGGWQSAVGQYACVLASYYPVYSFDPSCPYNDREGQMGAMIHEGIHAVLADLPGCKKAGWFHEGGNTWLQQEAYAMQSKNYDNMGFLNAGTFVAPFMPIECYSGWLQDGTFGGPSAEGVNRFEGGTQVSTWRNLLGGNQYGNAFPVFLGQTLGKGSVAWIWRNCQGRVLEGMKEGIGDMQMRRLIMEYRAKQALVDMQEWNGAVKKLLDGSFGGNIVPEGSPVWINSSSWKASPYVKTWMLDTENKILTPEPRTTPGWSGANQIPLNVFGDEVVVNFIPMGENMTCQLCYRAADGTPVYSYPVSEGECRLNLEKQPANGVVIAVICNTDYVYKGEETRKAHYDYRLQLVEGVSDKASIYKKWYDYNSEIEDVTDPEEPFPTEGATIYDEVTAINPIVEKTFSSSVYPNPLSNSDVLNIKFGDATHEKEIRILDAKGTILYVQKGIRSLNFRIPIEGRLSGGIYFMNVQDENTNDTHKIIIK